MIQSRPSTSSWAYLLSRKTSQTGKTLEQASSETNRNQQIYRGFKGLKQAIKLEFKLARYDQVRKANQLPRDNRADTHAGSRTLQGASHLRQVGCHTQLLGKVHQQHARLHREGC